MHFSKDLMASMRKKPSVRLKKSVTESKHPKSDWDLYDRYGYYPYDTIKLESVSRTLECGFDDYSAAMMAQKMGKTDDHGFFMKRSGYYRNLFDKETNSMRPKTRMATGYHRSTLMSWHTPTRILEVIILKGMHFNIHGMCCRISQGSLI